MNLEQMKVQLRDILTSGGGKNEATGDDDFWSDSELTTYLNMAQTELYKIIRRAREDFFTRVLRSTDSALQIAGGLFVPSTLRWVAGTGNYSLPRDFVRMKLITDLSTDRIRLMGSDIAKNEFRILMQENSGNQAREYLYDIIGSRTLVIRPIPQEVRDFEFIYEKLLMPMRNWSAGNLSLDNGSDQAEFSLGADIQNRLQVGDQLIPGDNAVDQVTADPDEVYPTIKSIDSATMATLDGPWLGSTLTNFAYRASSVSEVPTQHHSLMVAKAAVYGFKKGTNPSLDSAEAWQSEFSAMLPSLINDVESRQGSDPETVSAYMEDLYD